MGDLNVSRSRRTSSGHTETFQLEQKPNLAALRWRGRLGTLTTEQQLFDVALWVQTGKEQGGG